MVLADSTGISRAPVYSGICMGGRCFRLQGFHLLWRTIQVLRLASRIPSNSPTTPRGIASFGFRLLPVRSPLLGESIFLSFPPGTEMFQFPGLASCTYGFSTRYRLRGRFSHSDISGSTSIRDSPKLFATYYVLHRLFVPRHPP